MEWEFLSSKVSRWTGAGLWLASTVRTPSTDGGCGAWQGAPTGTGVFRPLRAWPHCSNEDVSSTCMNLVGTRTSSPPTQTVGLSWLQYRYRHCSPLKAQWEKLPWQIIASRLLPVWYLCWQIPWNEPVENLLPNYLISWPKVSKSCLETEYGPEVLQSFKRVA